MVYSNIAWKYDNWKKLLLHLYAAKSQQLWMIYK